MLGSFHAYFVFPLPDNDADSLDGLLETFLKIFRLEILSDFDLNELEAKGGASAGAVWSDLFGLDPLGPEIGIGVWAKRLSWMVLGLESFVHLLVLEFPES